MLGNPGGSPSPLAILGLTPDFFDSILQMAKQPVETLLGASQAPGSNDPGGFYGAVMPPGQASPLEQFAPPPAPFGLPVSQPSPFNLLRGLGGQDISREPFNLFRLSTYGQFPGLHGGGFNVFRDDSLPSVSGSGLLTQQGPGIQLPIPDNLLPPTPPTTGGGGGGGGNFAAWVPAAQGNSYYTNQGTHSVAGHPEWGAADIFGSVGDPITAPVGGVIQSFSDPVGGNAAVLRGDDGLYYYLAHGNAPFVSGRVQAGQQIGQVGNTGSAANTAPHLHIAASRDPNFGPRQGKGEVPMNQWGGGAAAPQVAPGGTATGWGQRAMSYAQQYGIDPRVFEAQMRWESGNYDPEVIAGRRKSRAGAIGIAQFMPDTARGYGVNPYDPEASLDGAARMMKDLLTQYGGDMTLALIAYNGGGGAVKAYLAGHPYAETVAYLTNIRRLAGGSL